MVYKIATDFCIFPLSGKYLGIWPPRLQVIFLSLFKYFIYLLFLYFKLLIYLFLERGREEEGEKHKCVAASHAPHTGDLACTQACALDWELNQWPFGSQASTQPALNPLSHTSQGYLFIYF